LAFADLDERLLPPLKKGVAPRAGGFAVAGFTLVELLVVVVIIGITLSLVVVNFRPDDKRVLSDEAQRVGLLLEHAHDEAVTSSQRMAWVADNNGYRFAVATGPDAWKELAGDDIFHARQWSSGVSFGGVRLPQNAASGWGTRLDFSPSGFNAPFEMRLAAGRNFAVIESDPLGRIAIRILDSDPGAYRFGS